MVKYGRDHKFHIFLYICVMFRKFLKRLSSMSVRCYKDSSSTYIDAPTAAPFPDTALPLLAALLARVPALQLKSVFPTPNLWLLNCVRARNQSHAKCRKLQNHRIWVQPKHLISIKKVVSHPSKHKMVSHPSNLHIDA